MTDPSLDSFISLRDQLRALQQHAFDVEKTGEDEVAPTLRCRRAVGGRAQDLAKPQMRIQEVCAAAWILPEAKSLVQELDHFAFPLGRRLKWIRIGHIILGDRTAQYCTRAVAGFPATFTPNDSSRRM